MRIFGMYMVQKASIYHSTLAAIVIILAFRLQLELINYLNLQKDIPISLCVVGFVPH